MRVSGGIQRLVELPARSFGGLAEIRARLLHEPRQRERGEPQALGVELNNGLAKPIALVQRLCHDWRHRFRLQFRADLIEQGDRTRVVVGITSVPSDPANPSLIAEIHKGSCGDLGSAPLYAVENTLGGYPPAPYYVGGILPVSLAALRSGAYAISVRTGPEAGSVELACGNIAKSSAQAVQQSLLPAIFAERLALAADP